MIDVIEQQYENFPKAPIKEAIYEIGIKEMSQEKIVDIEELMSSSFFKEHFPSSKPIHVHEKSLFIGEAPKETIKDKTWTQGYQLWSNDKLELHTCRLDGFSYNRLKPYISGKEAIEKFISGWDLYSEKLNPERLERFVVRNINVIDIPETAIELDEYINLLPDISGGLKDCIVTGFLSKFKVEFPEKKSSCSITMSVQPPSKPGYISFLLDIEAYKKIYDHSIDIYDEFQTLTNIKDKIFFSIITEKAKELFR